MGVKPSLLPLKGKKTYKYFFGKLTERNNAITLLQYCNAAARVFAKVQLCGSRSAEAVPHTTI